PARVAEAPKASPAARPALPEKKKETGADATVTPTAKKTMLPANVEEADKVALPTRGSRGSRGAEVEGLPGERAFNLPPPYPPDALAARLEGRVLLRVAIDAAGRVTDVRVHESSGVESLDQSALTTVRGWLFTPARRGGVPVPYEFLKPIEF